MHKFDKQLYKEGLVCEKKEGKEWKKVCPWFYRDDNNIGHCYLGFYLFTHKFKSKDKDGKDVPVSREATNALVKGPESITCVYEDAINERHTNKSVSAINKLDLIIDKKFKELSIDDVPIKIPGVRSLIYAMLTDRIGIAVKAALAIKKRRNWNAIPLKITLPHGKSKLDVLGLAIDESPSAAALSLLIAQKKQTDDDTKKIRKSEMAKRSLVWLKWGLMVRRVLIIKVRDAQASLEKIYERRTRKVRIARKRWQKKLRGYIHYPLVLQKYFPLLSELTHREEALTELKSMIYDIKTNQRVMVRRNVINQMSNAASMLRANWRSIDGLVKFMDRRTVGTGTKAGLGLTTIRDISQHTIDQLIKIEKERLEFVKLTGDWKKSTFTSMDKLMDIKIKKVVEKRQHIVGHSLAKADIDTEERVIEWKKKLSWPQKLSLLHVYESILHNRLTAVYSEEALLSDFIIKKYGYDPRAFKLEELQGVIVQKGEDYGLMGPISTIKLWGEIQTHPGMYSKDTEEWVKAQIMDYLGDPALKVKAEHRREVADAKRSVEAAEEALVQMNQHIENKMGRLREVEAEIEASKPLKLEMDELRKYIEDGPKVKKLAKLVEYTNNETLPIYEKIKSLTELKKHVSDAEKKKVAKKLKKKREELKIILASKTMKRKLRAIEIIKAKFRKRKQRIMEIKKSVSPSLMEANLVLVKEDIESLHHQAKQLKEHIIPQRKQVYLDTKAKYKETRNTVITVPHAALTTGDGHHTDWAATDLAKRIEKHLKEE